MTDDKCKCEKKGKGFFDLKNVYVRDGGQRNIAYYVLNKTRYCSRCKKRL